MIRIQYTADKNTTYSKDPIDCGAVESFHCSTGSQKGQPYFYGKTFHLFVNPACGCYTFSSVYVRALCVRPDLSDHNLYN